MKILNVDLGDRSYPIYIGKDLLKDKKIITTHIKTKTVCLVSNKTVSALYLKNLKGLLDDYQIVEAIIDDGEEFKNHDSLNYIYSKLLESQCNRDTTILALGGGVVGDIAGYAAATFLRGIPFIQIPTTLLAQVDSSVGGKTGINHALGKNMIGAFYQPQSVVIDLSVLKTLDMRQISAGLAEVIKYGLIWDKDFFEYLEKNIDNIKNLDFEYLEFVIHRSCEIKAKVVSEDEKESGIRAILNLGHTFGHAIENCLGYGEWLHGEAVGCGMVLAAKISLAQGWLSESEFDQVKNLISRANLPTEKPNIAYEEFIGAMKLDKKNKDKEIYLVLQKGIGKAIVTNNYASSDLDNVIKE